MWKTCDCKYAESTKQKKGKFTPSVVNFKNIKVKGKILNIFRENEKTYKGISFRWTSSISITPLGTKFQRGNFLSFQNKELRIFYSNRLLRKLRTWETPWGWIPWVSLLLHPDIWLGCCRNLQPGAI